MSVDIDLYRLAGTLAGKGVTEDEWESAMDWIKQGGVKYAAVVETENAPECVKERLRELGEEVEDNWIMVVVND